jgi:predicted nucleic acid-binding protein
MAIILDADVIIRGEKGSFDLERWLAGRADDEFALAAITLAELWHGVERATGPHRAKRERYLSALVERLPVIPYTAETALVHARIWAQLTAAGRLIGYYDLMVAATALEQGHQVATFNRRHFEAVADLSVIEPS